VVAMVFMAYLNAWLLYLSQTGNLPFAWSWLVVLGTLGTVLLALLFGALLPTPGAAPGTPRADTPASPTR
jgi:hypothetical protein